MDFGALPPEVNSGRMYSGAGPATLLAAAAGMGQAGRRTAHRRRRLPVADLGPDRRIVDGPVIDVHGGRGRALLDVDEKHRCPV